MAKLSRRSLAIYGADQLLANKTPGAVAKELASVLIASRRQNQSEQLVDDIAWELETRGRIANAQVTSARILSDALRKQISAHIKSAAKVQQVLLDEIVDKSVIGGLKIDTAAHSWDKTLRRKLIQIREAI
jgi:F0F1-type ATP synthase delta subunit